MVKGPASVLFGQTVQRLLDDGIDAVIEVGPHPTLLAGLAAERGPDDAVVLLGSLRRREPERAALLASLGALWTAGHPVAWPAQFPDGTYTAVALLQVRSFGLLAAADQERRLERWGRVLASLARDGLVRVDADVVALPTS